ncbi:MAG: RNA 2',3'-cyclic phosphodiesterase [Pyrinomonadaceae bacterium]
MIIYLPVVHMPHETTYRTFIAVEIPNGIRRRVTKHIDQLRSQVPDVRASWTREDNLHLTLKFLGEVPIARIPILSNAVAEASHDMKPFRLIVSSCGAFPARGRPKVLWIGVEARNAGLMPASSPSETQASSLHVLQETLEHHCETAGFDREARAYQPHLTIARLRDSRGSRELAEYHQRAGFPQQAFTVSELVVFRSELSSKGSKHTALSRHELNIGG